MAHGKAAPREHMHATGNATRHDRRITVVRSAMARLGKLTALLALVGFAAMLDNCSSTTTDDDAARPAPVTYGIGGPYW
jgi:hypothetical protein